MTTQANDIPENDADHGETDASEAVDLTARLELAEAEAADLKDKLLRAVAEAENVRRRAQKELEDGRKYAITGFARDLLAVADNLGRALDALPEGAENDPQFGALVQGVQLTGRELANVLERHGVKEVRPHGEKFDHNLHQAMFEVEDAEQPHGTVNQVLQVGYTIGDRLLRPAMVGVTKAPVSTDAGK
ncbi:nucleotide exchange factor GrpE [Iodidimonas sp. SYSU 1G8]|uniref:nucleotide exchange factor GrpE n=1 Tax=Iodidimonas sp. SYSU 1G8 TaxID=3133967 RepID=UPI0031FEE69F